MDAQLPKQSSKDGTFLTTSARAWPGNIKKAKAHKENNMCWLLVCLSVIMFKGLQVVKTETQWTPAL